LRSAAAGGIATRRQRPRTLESIDEADLMTNGKKPSMTKRMVIMLVLVGLVVGALVGFNWFKGTMIRKYMAQSGVPPATVSTTQAQFQDWKDAMAAVGSLRAVRGVDLSTEIAGLVRSVNFKSGDEVRAGQVLVELNADVERAQVNASKVAVDLAQITLKRDREQLSAEAVAQATVDNDDADLRSKSALVAQQQATLDKKTIRAPFAGRLGISTVNPGQYVNTGDKIVTLQAIDPVYVDFFLPQQDVIQLSKGQTVTVTLDGTQLAFSGTVNAINPAVDTTTRNIQVEATVPNPKGELVPGMYARVSVQTGSSQRYLTLPQSAITYNPYGATVFIGKPAPPPAAPPTGASGAAPAAGAAASGGANAGNGAAPAQNLVAAQVFVTPGPTRGDQVAILKGIDEGAIVVTSGQLKLKNGTPLKIDNSAMPADSPNPTPQER
jgi:membrane fusion protein (multidrug efflux system)